MADPGQAALAALDRALAKRPERDASAFTEATQRLCEMRDELIARGRTEPVDQERLASVNALISCSLSGHFPLGPVRWPMIESARAELDRLLT